MKVLNYNQVLKGVPKPKPSRSYGCVRTHKKHSPDVLPMVSVVLLDWSCRERFDTLDWLLKQDVPKELYELIWVELYDRVVPEVLEKANTVITCGQKGMYHKHVGYNVGLLNSYGEIIVICDSDAIYPVDFISSILESFYPNSSSLPQPLVLMHYQLRSSSTYPDNLKDRERLRDGKWQWWPLNPNVGACMSVRRQDAIRFGGFDEHKSFRGYLCGPYDLGWRLVNAGIPERWHDASTVLWHFAHPDPVGVNEIKPNLKRMYENTFPHVDLHALTAVEAFSTGRFQPLKENPEIFKLRMKERFIGTEFEEKYANITGGNSFSKWQIFWLRTSMLLDMIYTAIGKNIYRLLRSNVKKLLSEKQIEWLRRMKFNLFCVKRVDPNEPAILSSFKNFNIVRYRKLIYGVPQPLGPVDFHDEKQISSPLIIKGKTFREVKEIISGVDLSVLIPVSVENYRDYNIAKYRNLIFAIPHGIGPCDLSSEEFVKKSNILRAHSIDQAKELVDRYFLESTGKSKGSIIEDDVKKTRDEDIDPIEPRNRVLLGDMKTITEGEVAKVRKISEEIQFLVNSREDYIKKHGLDSEVYLPAGLWSKGAPNDFRKAYEYAVKCDYDTINNLRFFVQPFSGHHLMPASVAKDSRSINRILSKFDSNIQEIAPEPDEYVHAWIKAIRHMPDELIVNPPRMLGEIGWDVKGIVVNHDTYVYQECVNLMYESGLISWLMKRMSEKKQLTILEIGAGYGALAYFLKGLFPKASYIICDLPESMLFSAAYLYLTRPDILHSIYNGRNPEVLRYLNSGYFFVANYMFEDISKNLNGIDLVLNTLSFSEMSEAQVRYYASRAKQLIGKAGVLFEQNHDNKHLGLLYRKEQLGEYFEYHETITSDTIRQPPQGIADIWANVAVRQLIPEDLKI